MTLGSIITESLNPLRNGRAFGVLAGCGIVKCGAFVPEGGFTPVTGDVFVPPN